MVEESIMAESDKIDGFDKYEVESGARTLIEVQEIQNKPKFYAAVKKELARQVKAVQEAALEAKVSTNLKNIYRGKK